MLYRHWIVCTWRNQSIRLASMFDSETLSDCIQYLLNIQENMIMQLSKPTDRLLQNLVSFLEREHIKASQAYSWQKFNMEKCGKNVHLPAPKTYLCCTFYSLQCQAKMNTSGSKRSRVFLPCNTLWLQVRLINKDLFLHGLFHKTMLWPQNTFTILHDL